MFKQLNQRLAYIRINIGKGKTKKEDISFLIDLANNGNDEAAYLYGLILLLEVKDEVAALSWIKSYRTKISMMHETFF